MVTRYLAKHFQTRLARVDEPSKAVGPRQCGTTLTAEGTEKNKKMDEGGICPAPPPPCLTELGHQSSALSAPGSQAQIDITNSPGPEKYPACSEILEKF